MAERGVTALSDMELLMVVLGSGNSRHDVRRLSEMIHRVLEEKKEAITINDLKEIPGIGLAKASQVMAALEYGRRRLDQTYEKIRKKEDVVSLLGEYRTKKQEHFLVLTLDGANRLIGKWVVFIGTLNASMVHPREVFAHAISDRAASIILVHNHPSGQLEASKEDMTVTERLCRAGELLGIDILDHIILTAQASLSMKEFYPLCWK